MNLLEEFTLETSTLVTDEPMRTNFNSNDLFLTKEMTSEEFQSFIENKIFNLEEIYEMLSNNKEIATIFKQICIEIYKALEEKIKCNKIENKKTGLIDKRNLLAIGILFCSCENIEKIKLFFDIFKNDKEEFCKSDNLDDFLLTLFLISSYCLLSVRINLNNVELGIEKVSKDDLIKLVKIYELENCRNLVAKFNDRFFGQEGCKWENFRKKFEDIENGFGWVISSKGIRRKLEENNI